MADPRAGPAEGVLIVSQDEVPGLLPMHRCIDVMAETLAAVARGDAVLPLRQMVSLPENRGVLATMPSYLSTIASAGVKVITVFQGNEGTELDAHQGAVLLFEGERGRLRAVVDATEITAIRTAAVSGAATRALARADAGDVAILGSGTQARTHLEAMAAVRSLRRVRVWSRNEERARAFADREGSRHDLTVEAVPSAVAAVEGADIVCTTTSSPEPVLHGAWLSPRAHVNAVGWSGREGREVDAEAVIRSRLYVDRRESALAESGDIRIPVAEGAVGEDHILGEIGEVFAGEVEGRQSAEDITLFKSQGLAVEDAAAVHEVWRRATETGEGTWIDLGGRRR